MVVVVFLLIVVEFAVDALETKYELVAFLHETIACNAFETVRVVKGEIGLGVDAHNELVRID